MKVVPYINTIKNSEYKKFLDQPFDVKIISKYFADFNVFFYYKFSINNNTFELDYVNNTTLITTTTNTIKIDKIATTIYEFIEDLNKYNVQIYWSDSIFKLFEPEIILESEDVKKYYINLLNKINKSYELLQ